MSQVPRRRKAGHACRRTPSEGHGAERSSTAPERRQSPLRHSRSLSMQCVLAGSRYFGASVLDALRREDGVTFASVIVPAADDRLAAAAAKTGLPVHVLADPKIVPGNAIPDGTDLIVAAHTHARISPE